jgi:hypothetical protein
VIAEAGIGSGFMAHAAYLGYGPRGSYASDRVAWAESRNLPTAHLMAAARIMQATARDSDSVQPPLYRFSISFDPSDPVNPETMRRVADRTLADLGLSDHQVLIVAHCDTAHPHMHLMVNRVHPERLNVWNNWNDWARIEKSLRAQEVELGLRIVPGKHAPVPEQARDRAPVRARKLVRGDAAWKERVQRVAAPHLLAARSWEELGRALHVHGLSVRVDGGGLVVTDGMFKAKCSDIDRAASRKHLEGRLGAWRDRTALERAAPVAQPEPPQVPVPVRAPEPAPEARPRAVPAPAPAPARIPPAKLDHRRIAGSYRGAMDRLYADPAAARASFREALLLEGREAAAKTLRERPEAFGRVRPGAVPVQDRARDAAGEAYRWGGRLEATGRAEALRVGATLRQHNAVKAYDDAATALENAESRLQGVRSHRDFIRDQLRSLPDAAGKVYENPRAALWGIARHVRREGYDRTADAIQQAPERFGALRSVQRPRLFGLRVERDTRAAREAATRAAGYLRGLDFNRAHAAKAGAVVRAQDAVRTARTHLSALQPIRGTHAARAMEMQRLLTEAGKALQAAERAGLQLAPKLPPMLPAGKAAGLIRTAKSLGRDLATAVDPDRQHERGRGVGYDR